MVLEQISTVSDILLNSLFDKNAYSNSIKKATAFGFWKDICGSKFAKFSVPYDIKGGTLFVAVKNPQVMQELIFCKSALLTKIKDYFLPLNINIEEIRYNYQVWNKVNSDFIIEGDESLSYYSKEEVQEVALNKFEEEEISKVTNTISNLSFLDDKLKEKCSKNIINSIKAKKLRKNTGV